LYKLKVKPWLDSLQPDNLKKYLAFCESEKHDAKRQQGTINHIPEFVTMKARNLMMIMVSSSDDNGQLK